MQIILLKDVDKLGRRGEVVNVRDGYGRNFLFPRGFALPATSENQARLEVEKKQTGKKQAQKKEEAEKLAQQIEAIQLRLPVKVGEKEKLFGSVTSQDLAKALQGEGVRLDKKRILISEPIKSLGKHEVAVELDGGVKARLRVEVIKTK